MVFLLRQQLSQEPAITIVAWRHRLMQTHGVSCLERTMQTWLERARAIAPKRAIKRGSSDLPTIDNLEEHGDYLRGLLAEDPSIGRVKLREAIKAKGFLVSEQTMRTWLDRHHGVPKRAIKRGSSDLPTLENLEEHGDYLRGMLAEAPSIGFWKLREAMKERGFLVSQ